MKAIDAVEDIGANVVGVIALIDRLAGAVELFQGYNYLAIFTLDDFRDLLPK